MNFHSNQYANHSFHDQPTLADDDWGQDDIVDLLAVACDDRNFGRYLGRSTYDQEV